MTTTTSPSSPTITGTSPGSDGSDGSPSTSPTGAATSAPAADPSAADTTNASPTTARRGASSGSTSTTALLPAASGLPAELPKNSQGVEVRLDETALLACAQDRIAWVALQGGAHDEASTALGIAARRAEASAVPEVRSSAQSLSEAASSSSPDAAIDRFLALCVTNGFES